ncbi:Pyruvate/Phosphoenolpyruvate kinase-like domain-containing protein [Phialemonium atrogriseum]|uniref:Pyruvate/Phosphoenolpyruvate kinase-like domain-containing protein n=1 Tax=Phialemonium atrogriseum TaxID=1093897 RepID=A0AAJ0C5D7_9PEZI|nr:Pyruvate/Phosphoenolpyruvate kinase-like domain-containing protein [Phialemonium atrogriseum]KAK1770266.1 Pyruvate/Phosphoenolpyruvate kinase-like domain-containing protein [Phialemonium atrogriseum]
MVRAGFDWMLINIEHSPLSARDATTMVHAIAVGSYVRCASLVRIPSTGAEWVKWALDSGAAGIVAPMVQTAEEAERLVRFTRYPPLGQRSFGPFNAACATVDNENTVIGFLFVGCFFVGCVEGIGITIPASSQRSG